MGGNLGVTIRKEDGQEFRMSRWTNSMPGFVASLKFINKEQEHFDGYMNAWLEMKKDWEENNKTGNFKLNMTSVYAPFPFALTPDEYGLVVIDYQTSTILHCQGYCGIGVLYVSEILMMSKGSLIYGDEQETKNKLQEYKELFIANELKLQYYIPDVGYVEEAAPKTFDEFIKIAKKDKKYSSGQLLLDMSPWKVIQFNESKKGFLQMKEAIIKLGFILTHEDEKQWDEYINCRFEHDEEE